MRLKKIAAVIAAAAMAVSITAVNAFAAVTNYPDGYSLELAGEGYDLTAVYGFSAQLSGDYAGDSGCGGCMAFMSVSTDWEQHEFGNDGSGKEIITTEDGVITILKTSPVFKASDEYGQVCIQSWWGGDFAVDSVTILGKDGKALTAGGGGQTLLLRIRLTRLLPPVMQASALRRMLPRLWMKRMFPTRRLSTRLLPRFLFLFPLRTTGLLRLRALRVTFPPLL